MSQRLCNNSKAGSLFLVGVALVTVGLLAVGCGSDPAEGGNDDNGADNGNGGEQVQWDQGFVFTGELVQANCAAGGCHGEPTSDQTDLGFGNNDVDLSFAQIREVFESYEGADGMALISPGEPEQSQLYLAITSDDTDVLMPPPPIDSIDAAAIETIRNWIEDGAKYELEEESDAP